MVENIGSLGAPDCHNSLLVDQLCDAVLSRLKEDAEGNRLLIRVPRVRIPPGSLSFSGRHHNWIFAHLWGLTHRSTSAQSCPLCIHAQVDSYYWPGYPKRSPQQHC